jgi:glutamate synthase (ferredoxin)
VGEPNRVSRESPLNEQLIAEAGLLTVECSRQLAYSISNRDRTFGAGLAGEIARRFGDDGVVEGAIHITLHGSAGQSFGAFGVRGMHLTLIGEANDYVGKGLGGGRIVIHPPSSNHHSPAINHPVLAGNTALYGATGGDAFIAGRAGERFAVRNSGATAIVEGVGDHGCEYMTGGLVIVLGSIGYNFAAGMTGGVAYVLDEDGQSSARINTQLVNIELPTPNEVDEVRQWLIRHVQLTLSPKAQFILRHWSDNAARFLKIAPRERPDQAVPILVAVPATAERVAVAD